MLSKHCGCLAKVLQTRQHLSIRLSQKSATTTAFFHVQQRNMAKVKMSNKQKAVASAAMERAKNQNEGMEEEDETMAPLNLDNVSPQQTTFKMQDFTPQQVKLFFENENAETDTRFSVLLENSRSRADLMPKKDPVADMAADSQETAKQRFERQLGFDEDFGKKEQEIARTANQNDATPAMHKPKLAKSAMQSFYNSSDKAYKLYVKKSKVKPLIDYSQYENGAMATGIGGEKPAQQVAEDRQSKMDLYKKAQEFVAQKFVDKPNPNFAHLFAKDAPVNVSAADAAKMYIISNDEYKRFFPAGLGGELDQVFDVLCQRALMVRAPVVPILEQLQVVKQAAAGKKVADEQNKRGFVFNGIRGSGKSAMLATVVHAAYKSGFLVVNIPSAHYWTQGIHFVEPSPLLKGYFDCPIAEEAFLKAFQSSNAELLKTLKLSKNYDFPLEPGQKQPQSLFDLISYGLSLESNLPIAFKILMDEILALKDIPVLFAIDDYNFFNDYTAFHFGNLDTFETTQPQRVHAKQYTLVRAIDRVIFANKANHLVVAANTNKWRTETKQKLQDNVLDIVQVPRYSYQELRNMIDYYMSAYWVFAKPEHFLEDVIFLSGGVPANVWKQMYLV